MLKKKQILRSTHLNTGGGWDCAWQSNVSACSDVLVSVVLLNSSENDGALDPIGSALNIYLNI